MNAETGATLMVPVEDGKLRMFHHRPGKPETDMPVFFIPGWGTAPEGFSGFFRGMNGRAEYYYFETREKSSSVLDRGKARFSMDSHGRDLAAALGAAGLDDGRPFLLVGTCWGSSVAAWALAHEQISCGHVILFDPMERLWFPSWILHYLLPFLPVSFWRMIRPIGKSIALHGMKERVQRQRTSDFIDSAELWKWKRAALGARDFSFLHIAGRIPGEILVVNGVQDKVHDASVYPRLAAAIPGGRFLRIPTDEALREELIASVSIQYSSAPGSTDPK